MAEFLLARYEISILRSSASAEDGRDTKLAGLIKKPSLRLCGRRQQVSANARIEENLCREHQPSQKQNPRNQRNPRLNFFCAFSRLRNPVYPVTKIDEICGSKTGNFAPFLPKKRAFFLIFANFLPISTHFFAIFCTFLPFFTKYFLPILPKPYKPTCQPTFLP